MPEVTDNYVRVPSGKRKKKNSEIRTIDISSDKGIKALYDVKNKVIVTYLFDKDKWTMKEAKEWVKKNKDKGYWDIFAENKFWAEELSKERERIIEEVERNLCKPE